MIRARTSVAIAVICASLPSYATTYYVRPDGDDAKDGRSHASAWKSTAKVNNSTLATGDDVYFLSGGVWHDSKLTIDWSGTPSDSVVVGSYWIRNGAETIGVGAAGRPEINGTYEQRCRASIPSTCPVDEAGAVPASKWSGLIDVVASYVTIKDLRVADSSGSGIQHVGKSIHHHLTVDNVEVERTYKTGVWFDKAAHAVLRNSSLNLVALQKVDGREAIWPAAVTLNDANPAFALIEGNSLKNSGGEGVITIRSSHAVVRRNTIADNRRPLVLLDNTSDSIVEQNLLVGNGYMNGQDESFGVGVAISVEPFKDRTLDSVRNIVRNNLMANTRGCFSLAVFRHSNYNCGGDCNDPAADGRKLGARVHGNTCVQDKGRWITGNNLDVNDNVDRVDFANNLFVGGAEENCEWPALPATKVTFRNNMFSGAPSDSDCVGTNHIVGDAGLVARELSQANGALIPSADKFRPIRSSKALDSGVPLTRAVLDLGKYNSDYASRGACGQGDSTELAYDFDCTLRGSTPSIGALEESGASKDYLLSIE